MLVFFPKPNRLKEKHKNMDDYFALYRKQKAATIERIRNSADYQQQCTAARMATNQQQLDFDEAYTKAKEEYDSVLLPRYQAARSAWETEHQAQIRKEEQELAQAKKELAALYGETRIVRPSTGGWTPCSTSMT